MTVPTLNRLRAQIDILDAEILEKLSARARCAQTIGALKKQENDALICYAPEREYHVLTRLAELNEGPLSDKEVMRLFREVMSACLALEQPLNIAYLGPEGTFTQAAVLKQFGQSVATCPVRSIAEVFKKVETGECHYGVVPVENSTEGMVTYTLDMLASSPLNICGEVVLRIVQNLLTHAENLEDIHVIYAHSQSLAQCRDWVDAHLPHAEKITVLSNAEAAKLAASNVQTAAIASAAAADLYELPLRYAYIEDDRNNTTRFLVIGQQEVSASGNDKTSVLVSSHNRPGLLYRLLEPIGRHGINMTRIESRPSRQGIWEYVFFIDLEGHQSNPNMQALFSQLRDSACLFRVLGSYPKAMA